MTVAVPIATMCVEERKEISDKMKFENGLFCWAECRPFREGQFYAALTETQCMHELTTWQHIKRWIIFFGDVCLLDCLQSIIYIFVPV